MSAAIETQKKKFQEMVKEFRRNYISKNKEYVLHTIEMYNIIRGLEEDIASGYEIVGLDDEFLDLMKSTKKCVVRELELLGFL